MPIKVACKCGQTFAAKDELAGKTVKCPKCASAITIPSPKVSAGAAPRAPAQASAKRPAAAAPVPATGGLADLLSEEGFSGHAGLRCTNCNTPIPVGGVVCTKCGMNMQTGERTVSTVKKKAGPGHGEAADDILARAAKEIAASPIQMKANDFGDGKSIWTWVILPFLPLLVVLGFAVVIIWGGALAAPVVTMFNAAMAGQYELLIPGLLAFVGLGLIMVGWFGISTAALEQNVWQGIASLITLGWYAPIYGTAHYRVCKYPMELYWYGFWAVMGAMSVFNGIASVYMKIPIFILPLTLIFIANFLTWLGTYRVTLTAFNERALFGYLSMLVPFYVFIYGGTRWATCKKDMILALVGIGITVLAIILAAVLGSFAFFQSFNMDTVIKPPPAY